MIYYAKNRVNQERKQIIHRNSRARSQKQSLIIFFEIVGIDRHGFCPTEPHQRETDKTRRIEMAQRIQRQSAIPFRRRIPAFVGDKSMREFMQRQYDDDRQKTDQNPIKIENKIHTMLLYPIPVKKATIISNDQESRRSAQGPQRSAVSRYNRLCRLLPRQQAGQNYDYNWTPWNNDTPP